MKASEKLADLLSDALGFSVSPDDLHSNKGYWSHRHQDVHRWEATIPVPRDQDEEYRVNDDHKKPWKRIYREVFGQRTEHIMLVCDDTMTECAKRGINLERDEWEIIVSAKSDLKVVPPQIRD